ncbi:MAG: hypothetical protein ABTS22_03755 [Accumulibacter sp.]|uniref:hypothetical protein n=1 Tax=Accumulibacter sp. TaxID=2053492 RepID=UPI0033145FCE
MSIIAFGLAALGLLALFRVFRRMMRRGLAPTRLSPEKKPSDLGLPCRNLAIPTAREKCLQGWLVLPEMAVGMADGHGIPGIISGQQKVFPASMHAFPGLGASEDRRTYPRALTAAWLGTESRQSSSPGPGAASGRLGLLADRCPLPKRLRYHLEHDPAIETLARRTFLSLVAQRCPDRSRCLVLACVQHHPKTAERLCWHTFWPARTPAANCLHQKRTPRSTPCFAGFFVYTF